MNITEIAGLEETESFELEWTSEITNKTLKVKLDARRASLTPQFFEQIGSYATYPKIIADLVTEWDVTDAQGQMWPLTETELKKLPIPFLTAVINTVTESWTGDKKKPQTSANGSAAAAK